MKNKLCLLCWLVSFLLSGCIYESAIPLGEVKDAAMDRQLLGSWVSEDSENNERCSLSFYRFNDNEYLVILSDVGKESDELYRAYGTIIDGNHFLNYHQLDDRQLPQPLLSFVKYEIKDDILSIWAVKDELLPERVETSEELRRLFRSNLNTPDFLEPLPLLIRQEEDGGL